MALFKVYRGNESNLPATLNDGWAYFCTNTGNFYIDWADSAGTLTRAQVNAGFADKVRYLNGDEYVEISAIEIATAVEKAHEHANLSVLNEIDQGLLESCEEARMMLEEYLVHMMNGCTIANLCNRDSEYILTSDGIEITALKRL